MAQATRRSRIWDRRSLSEAMWLTFTVIAGQVTLAAIAAGAALALFAGVADWMAEGQTLAFDQSVVHYFHTHQPAWLREPVLAITFLANGWTIAVVLALSVGVLIGLGRIWPDGAALMLAGLGGFGFVETVKAFFHRARPSIGHDFVGYSFPSGHSFLSMAMYGMLAYYLSLNAAPRHRRLIWVLAGILIFLIGSSRVLLGAHYPSDVLAGFASGMAWLWACLALRKVFRRRDWKQWKSERLARLTVAKRTLDELESQREVLERRAAEMSRSPQVGWLDRTLLRGGRWLERQYPKVARRFEPLRRHPYDLLLIGVPLARVEKSALGADLPDELGKIRRAQRGLFGLNSESEEATFTDQPTDDAT